MEKQVITSDLREKLKALMKAELDQLPETLQAMEPKERLNILCRLLPYVLPKVESINHSAGEPLAWD